RRPASSHHGSRESGRAETPAFRAVEGQRADIGGFQVVLAYRSAAGFVDLFLGVGDLHAHDVGGIEQTVGVGLQAENRRALIGVVGTHAFEHTHAVVQRVG